MPDSRDPELRNDFLRLLAQSEAAIRTFLRAILYSQSDTDEAFQNTLITLWDKFEEYDTKKDFKPWAFGIARFKALSIIRDRQREKLVFGDSLLNQFADDTIAAGDRYLTQEEALDGCLMKLPGINGNLFYRHTPKALASIKLPNNLEELLCPFIKSFKEFVRHCWNVCNKPWPRRIQYE